MTRQHRKSDSQSVRDKAMRTQEIKKSKAVIRDKYRQIRCHCDNKPEKSKIIAEKIFSSMSYRYCKDILLYCPKGDEVDTGEIFKKAISDGKNVYFPKTFENGIMRFYKVSSQKELIKAKFGLFEPDGLSPEYSNSHSPALCIVPGICFDRNGNRVGYGKGYYDRFLSSFNGISAGITYSDCVLTEKIPVEKRYDKPVDIIFSESEVIIVGGK